MRNNAHLGETREQRMNRFQENSPYEIVSTITNSMANFFMNELEITFNTAGNYQTSLMLLGTHSIALTLAHGFFGKGGPNGYKMFLEQFIDGDTPDTKFSTVASRIHEWRNVVAHRWINVAGHSFAYDFDMLEGWKIDGETLVLNPKIYLEQFIQAFGSKGSIYQYDKVLTSPEEWEAARQRFISKYTEPA